MATPATATQGPASVRDITPRSGRPSGRPGTDRTTEQELVRVRRTVQTGIGRGQRAVESLVKLHKNISDTFDRRESKYTQELSQVSQDALKNIQKPSVALYGSFIFISLIVDIFVSPLVTAAWVTVIGGIAATIALSICMVILTRLLLGKRSKRTVEYRKELEGRIREVQEDVQQVQAEYVKFRRWARLASRRFPQIASRAASVGARLGRTARNIKPVARVLTWLAKFFRNPAIKQGGEAIPLVNIIPFWTLGAIGAYIAHRAEYQEAQRLLNDYARSKSELIGITADMYKTQLAVVEQEAVGKMDEIQEQQLATA